MRTLFLFLMLAVVSVGSSAKAQDPPASEPATQPAPAEQVARPALAVKFRIEGDNAKVIFALNYLQTPKDFPKFTGVRFYTYTVPLTGTPTRVGLDKAGALDAGPVTAILDGQKYVYLATATDRQENGTLSLSKPDKPEAPFHARGVYFYMNHLFIINADLKPNDPLFLFESTDPAK